MPCERSEHGKTNPTPQNGYRHYLALPTRHPKWKGETYRKNENGILKEMEKVKHIFIIFAVDFKEEI